MQQTGRKKKWWVMFVAAVVIVVAASVVLVVSALPDESRTDELLARWEAAGGATTFEAWRPEPVASDDNAAELYEQAFAAFGQLSPDAEHALRDKAMDDATRRMLDEVDEAIELAFEASWRPVCRLPDSAYQYSIWPDDVHFLRRRQLGLATTHRAALAAEQDELSEAVEYLAAARRIVRHFEQEPLMVSVFLSSALDHRILETFERIFEDRPLPANVDELLDAGPDDDLARRMILKEGGGSYLLIRDLYDDEVPGLLSHIDVQYFLESMLRTLDEFERPARERDWSFLDEDEMPMLANYSRIVIANYGDGVEVIDRMSLLDRAARVAVELRQHRDAHGSYPDEDQWTMPTEPLNDEAIEYERRGEGFVLHIDTFGDGAPLKWHWQ